MKVKITRDEDRATASGTHVVLTFDDGHSVDITNTVYQDGFGVSWVGDDPATAELCLNVKLAFSDLVADPVVLKAILDLPPGVDVDAVVARLVAHGEKAASVDAELRDAVRRVTE